MSDKFLRIRAVTVLTGLSRTSIFRYERAGNFPRRRRLGTNAVAWLESEVREWIGSRPIVASETALG